MHHGAALAALTLPLVVSAVALPGRWKVTDAWVRPVTGAYADRLLDAVETLSTDTPSPQVAP